MIAQKPTFDEIPSTLFELHRKTDLILSLLSKDAKPDEADKLLTIEKLIDSLPEKPARQTIYGWVNNRLIPYEKHGKRLYFRRSEIDRWLNNGRQVK